MNGLSWCSANEETLNIPRCPMCQHSSAIEFWNQASVQVQGMFQNLDPKFVTFFHVLRHFKAHKGHFEYRNRNLDKIPVILVCDLALYMQY